MIYFTGGIRMSKAILGVLVGMGLLYVQAVSAAVFNTKADLKNAKTPSSTSATYENTTVTSTKVVDNGTADVSSEKKIKKSHRKHRHHRHHNRRHHHRHHHHQHYHHHHHKHPHHHYSGQDYGQQEVEARSRLKRQASGTTPVHARKIHMQEMQNYMKEVGPEHR